MKRAALFALATAVLAACDQTTEPEVMAPIQAPQFATINVPGDYSTIQAAHDAASSGDTILLQPGTYVEQIEISKAIVLGSLYLTTGDESYIGSTILDGNNRSYTIAIPSGAEDGATIQGVTIQNSDDGITPRARFNLLNSRITDTSDGVDYEDGSGGLVQFCTFELNSDDGIDLDNSVDIVIQDNIIRDNNDDGIEIRMQSHSGSMLNIIITRNMIHGNGEDGIQLIWYDTPTDRFFEISYNYIYDNVDVGIGMMDNSTTSEDFRAASIPERINVFNNTFSNNSHGITGGDNTVVLNNIFVGHPVIAVKNVDGNSELAYNLFYNNGTDNSGSNVDGGSSVFADPLLTANLELQAGSPAIDAGTAFYVWQTETVLDLPASAYSGAAPDMGAFEFDSGTGPPPDPPVLASPADGAVDLGLTPTLTWTGDGDNFTVQVATDDVFSNIVDAATVSTTDYTVAAGALDYSTTYFWRVNASNANGTSDYSTVWSFTTAAAGAPPDPPVLTSPADAATDVPLEAILEWAGTADDFDVEVAADAGFASIVFSTNTAATTVTLPPGTLDYETVYYWHARGNNSFGPGAFSDPFSFTTVAAPDTEPPSQPQNLTSPSQTGTTVDLVWDASTDNVGVSHYNIYQDGFFIGSESSTNHTATDLTPATSYDFQVSALDAAGNESLLSEPPLSVTTLDTIDPTAPGTPTLDSKTDVTVSISWTAATDNVGVTEYRVFRDGALAGTVAAPTTSFIDSGLAPATTYTYHVTALDAAGNESLASGTLDVTTDPGPEPTIHVGGIAMQLRKAGKWNIGRAVISIVDESGAPVDGATVVAQWSGLTSDLDSGTTSGGDVQFDSDKVNNSQSGQFVITVTDVSASGFVYDPTANVQTEGCIDSAGNLCSAEPPDTDPPAAPASLTATPGEGTVALDWPDNTEPDLASYSVHRSTTSGGPYSLVVEGLTDSQYTDTGLTGGTNYFYVVTAKDTSGNESGNSPEASATPSDPPALSVHVANISVAIVQHGRNYYGSATVSVVDQDGLPVAEVEVVGDWTYNSAGIGASSGTTDGGGVATVDSAKQKAASGDVFTFTVTDLILAGYTYDAASNVETWDSTTVP